MFPTEITLQREQSIAILPDADLLIVAEGFCCEQIQQMVRKLPAKLTCTTANYENLKQTVEQQQYDLIIYYYSKPSSNNDADCELVPLPQLSWWYEAQKPCPLILIAEPLGEQKAIALIRSGVSDYILDSQLDLLPQAIVRALANRLWNSSCQLQQLVSEVQSLQYQISLLEEENAMLQDEETFPSSDYFSHLNHELRSPLANILQFAKMLKAQHFGPLNQKQAEYMSGIITSSNHLFELINDYLDIAKIDANSEELYIEKIAVEDICDAATVMIQGKAKEKDLQLILDIAPEVDFCHADSLRLKQILINLLSNAIKFTEQGSVTLKVVAIPHWLTFSVIDTGIGISEADATKLFQPFQQLNTPLHRKQKGTGLGLALSRKLAQLHGGDITLQSEEGKGSCFTLSLPRR